VWHSWQRGLKSSVGQGACRMPVDILGFEPTVQLLTVRWFSTSVWLEFSSKKLAIKGNCREQGDISGKCKSPQVIEGFDFAMFIGII